MIQIDSRLPIMSEREKFLEELKARISRMINVELLDTYHSAVADLYRGAGDMANYLLTRGELEKRMHRTGFLPPTEGLMELRQAPVK